MKTKKFLFFAWALSCIEIKHFPCKNRRFSTLSTKLSTGFVDKGRMFSVYGDLAEKLMQQMNCVLRRMIYIWRGIGGQLRLQLHISPVRGVRASAARQTRK
ncbi:hypothetical protein I4X03_003900 [Massilia sp. R798]|uniref:Secreted protein n=1 Tax=Massilia soli TaxID=2792854 RepID=A0ABS7SL40_9BURK|nr:hypothetical protein [Massilia soli]